MIKLQQMPDDFFKVVKENRDKLLDPNTKWLHGGAESRAATLAVIYAGLDAKSEKEND